MTYIFILKNKHENLISSIKIIIMEKKHKNILLIVFYLLLVTILIFNYLKIPMLSNNDKIFMGVALSMFIIVSLLNNRNYIETFETSSASTTTSNTNTNSENNEKCPSTNIPTSISSELVVTNQNNVDDFIKNVTGSNLNIVACYFTTYDFNSIDFEKKQWKSISDQNRSHSFSIKYTDKIDNIYNQNTGFNTGININQHVEFEGYPTNQLCLSNKGIEDITVFWYAKMNFSPNDYKDFTFDDSKSESQIESEFSEFEGNKHNIFELYSNNVKDNVALGCKLFLKRRKLNKNSNEYIYRETFLINYCGIKYAYEIKNDNKRGNKFLYFDNNNYHLFTLVKYIKENGEHYIKMVLDNENEFLPSEKVDMNEIEFVNNNSSSVELSNLKFTLNKKSDGSLSNTNTYMPMKMYLKSFGILNTSVHENPLLAGMTIIPKIFQHYKTQDVKISPVYVEHEQETSDIITEFESYKKCKMNSDVCKTCSNVNWNDMSSVLKDEACRTSIIDRCNQLNDGNVHQNFTNEEKDFCYAFMDLKNDFRSLFEKDFKTSSSNCHVHEQGNKVLDKPTQFEGMQTIVQDKYKRNNYNVAPSVGKLADGGLKYIDYNQLDNDQYVKKHIVDQVINDNHNHNKEPRLDVYYDGTAHSGASRTEPPIVHYHPHQHARNIDAEKLANFDVLSQTILDKPIHNMTYDELLNIAKAKKMDIHNISDVPIASSTSSSNQPNANINTKLSEREISSLAPGNLNERELYDSVMKQYEDELEKNNLKDEDESLNTNSKKNGNDGDTKSSNETKTGFSWFKSLFGF